MTHNPALNVYVVMAGSAVGMTPLAVFTDRPAAEQSLRLTYGRQGDALCFDRSDALVRAVTLAGKTIGSILTLPLEATPRPLP